MVGSLPVLNLEQAKYECIYGRGCDGICCQAGRPPVYPEEKQRIELLQGTLDLLILRTLLLGPAHGHAIAKAIEFRSDEVLQVEQGSLYPALHRLIKRRWISVEEGTSENNRRAKFYRLTTKGRRQLALETSKWDKLAGAIARILRPTEEG